MQGIQARKEIELPTSWKATSVYYLRSRLLMVKLSGPNILLNFRELLKLMNDWKKKCIGSGSSVPRRHFNYPRNYKRWGTNGLRKPQREDGIMSRSSTPEKCSSEKNSKSDSKAKWIHISKWGP